MLPTTWVGLLRGERPGVGGPESSQEKAPLSFGGGNQLAIHFPGLWWGLAGETLSQAWARSLCLVP